jgi:hypothetical protein
MPSQPSTFGTGGVNGTLFQFRWFNGIWECCDDAKVQRGTGSVAGLRRLELGILRSEKRVSHMKSASDM